jgi:hypothetical protein
VGAGGSNCCVWCAGLFWVAYATVNVAFKDQVLALKERNQYRARLEYEDRIGELRSTIDKLNRRLLLDQRAYLAKVDEVRLEHDKLVDRHEQLAEFFKRGWLPSPNQRWERQRVTRSAGRSRARWTPACPVARLPPAAQAAALPLPRRWPAKPTVREFTTREEVLKPLEDVRAYMAGMETREASLLQQVAGFMESKNAQVASVYRSLGINAQSVASTSSYQPEAVGGPFIAASAGQMGSPLAGIARGGAFAAARNLGAAEISCQGGCPYRGQCRPSTRSRAGSACARTRSGANPPCTTE